MNGRSVLAGEPVLHVTADIGQLDWTLHYFAPEKVVRDRAVFVTLLLSIFLALSLATALFLRSRRIRIALASSQSARRKLRQANRDLEQHSRSWNAPAVWLHLGICPPRSRMN